MRESLFCPLSKQVEKLEYRAKINSILNVLRKMTLGSYCLFMLNSLRYAKNTFGKSLHVCIFQNFFCANILTVVADNLFLLF